MLSDYANQSLTRSIAGARDQYNQITYSTAVISGRMEIGFKMVNNQQGQEVLSSAFVMTETPVVVDDKIDGRLVVSVKNAVDLDGTTLFYGAYLQ